MNQETQPVTEKKTRAAHKRKAHTSALENADNIAQLIKAGQDIPFLLPIPFAERGKAVNICAEGHKARLEIFECLPEDQKPYYTWTLRPVPGEDGTWWIEVGPRLGKQRQVSQSSKAFSDALREAVEAVTGIEEKEYAPAPTTDEVLKNLGYF